MVLVAVSTFWCAAMLQMKNSSRKTNRAKLGRRLAYTIGALCAVGAVGTRGEAVYELPALEVRGALLRAGPTAGSVSASVYGQAALDAAALTHTEDLYGGMPNVNGVGGTNRVRFLQVRGIGENSQFGNELPASAVGVAIDGIELTGIGGVLSLFDVGHVELLRGPQSIAEGATALAGQLNVDTLEPTAQWEGLVEVAAGDDAHRRVGLAAGGALDSDGAVRLRLAVEHTQRDGFRDNVYLGRSDTNGLEEQMARLRFNWDAGARVRIDSTLLYADYDGGYDAWALDNDSFETTTDEPGQDTQQTLGWALRTRVMVSDNVEVTYRFSVADTALYYAYDWDWSNPAELIALYGPEVYYGIDATARERRVLNSEVRLRGERPWGRLSEWVVGVHWRDFLETQDYFGVGSDYRTAGYAAYGAARWELAQGWSVEMALRGETHSLSFARVGGAESRASEGLWGGNVALQWAPLAQHQFYAAVDRGYKAGGVNLDDDIPPSALTYDGEALVNWELGWRAYWGRLQSQLTLFAMERRDIQTDGSVQTGDGNTFALYKTNAAQGYNRGAEWQLEWWPTETLRLSAALGWLEARYTDYRYVDPNAPTQEVDYAGRRQPYAPAYTYRLGGEWRIGDGYFVGGVLRGRDAYTFDLASGAQVDAHAVLDLAVGWRGARTELVLSLRNALDERYVERAFRFANEPPLYATPRNWQSHGDPRHWALTLRRTF